MDYLEWVKRPIKFPAGEANLLVWDIEAMSFDFNPAMGEILCVAFQHPSWMNPRVISYDDFVGYEDLDITERDKFLCMWMEWAFADAEILVGHYSTGFDLPFVQSRMMHHGCKPFVHVQHIDTYKLAKKNFNPGRKFAGSGPRGLSCSLNNLAKFLNLPQQKGSNVSMLDWRRLMTNDYPLLMRRNAEYCRQDVRTTLALFDRLKTLPGLAVNLSLAAGKTTMCCTSCGSTKLQSRGTRTTKTQQYRRYQCECGHWNRGRLSSLKPGGKHLMPT